MDILPEHNIGGIISEELGEEYTLPIIVMDKENAHITNAEQLGFKNKKYKTTRYEALKIKKPIIIQKPIMQKINITKNTTLHQY